MTKNPIVLLGILCLVAVFGCAALMGLYLLRVVSGERYWTEHTINETTQYGHQIVQSLEEYRSNEGAYPDALSSLVPSYAPSIPRPTTGFRSWHYWVSPGGDAFELAFFANRDGYPSKTYYSHSQRWEVDQ